MSFLERTRTSYDTVAASYSTLFADDLPTQPVKRAMLRLFAELASGPTADVGCGPGYVTAFLHEQGLDVFGVDLSPGMIAQDRANHPAVRFEVGSMTALDHPDGSLAGLNAWFSTIHIPDAELPAVFAEFHRVLTPGAPLLLAFQAGDIAVHYTSAWGHDDVDLTIHRRRPEEVAALLTKIGFRLLATTLHEIGDEGRQAAFLIAHKIAHKRE
ncbi:class I SAM-dependent methyltransferase [Actinoplanes sp. NPDC049596]|uniref:class I SAM-dependent DNA methyltransferase n=1 Tax=unclassified Actinoplanes TaxID=2626549 RepID=UPI0034247E84